MDKQRGLTRTEVVVIIVVVAFIALIVIGLGIGAAILMPALQKPREQGKRAVCHNNLKQLALAWIIYADENDDRIVNGAAGSDRAGELAWVGKDWHDDYKSGGQLPEYQQISEIKKGALWPYCKNLKLYRCPSGIQGEMRTYSLVDSMNGVPRHQTQEDNVRIKKWSQIPSQAKRIIFIDVGWAAPGSFAVYYDKEQWLDPPPIRHGEGTNVSFADGHSEYWKWKGKETIKLGRTAGRTRPPSNVIPQSPQGKEDLHRVQKAVWGKLGYEPKP
ncbi:MAG: hypothetical protein ACYS6W_06780 [Planctomycetota bacterium]